jgi:SpoVK/Ycf46/Vps4 family AAA+-type ATPase
MLEDMNILDYAPEKFKNHLRMLDKIVMFNEARNRFDLGFSNKAQNYVFTGNDGTGVSAAVSEIFERMKRICGLTEYKYLNALSMYDANEGFASSLDGIFDDDTLVHIDHAECLNMKGHIYARTGVEDLCSKMRSKRDCVVVLSGSSQLTELVQGNDDAKDLFTYFFRFDDLTPDAMFDWLADYANDHNYMFAPQTEKSLKAYLAHAYKLRGSKFRNIYFLEHIFNRFIIPKMAKRVMTSGLPEEQADLVTIMPEDLPTINHTDTDKAIQKLKSLVGLDDIKKKILDHTALVMLNSIRAEKGMHNKMPPMHMVFTGNPGTGKTTIAKYIGEIYHSIGVLSSGHVVVTERSKLIGEWIGDAEKRTREAISSASGGVLFIDEAYNLFTDSSSTKDYGMRVIETLLTHLGSDDTDMIVILAGYSGEMNRMMKANPGMKSRFPYVFKFEDYTPEQLMMIGKQVLEKEHFTMTEEAEEKLTKYVVYACEHKDEHFGNGRFITRLITTQIIPALSHRLLNKPADEISLEEMSTIEACDIPDIEDKEYKVKDVDEIVLTKALERLNEQTGMQNAKKALNDYVAISRLSHQQKTLKITPQSLCWDFIGKTGTGKSTVAEILGKILQGLGILKRGHTICVNADELTGSDCYTVLERAIKEACDGLLFLDMDAPNVVNADTSHLRMWIFNKLRELRQTTALVFAQVKASEEMIAQNLAVNGIASYSNYIVFNDFTVVELTEILVSLLKNEFHLDITSDAKQKVQQYIERVKASETKESPVNARTIFHLAQTIAHITQFRLATSEGKHIVTLQDVSHFKWDGRINGKVGFI